MPDWLPAPVGTRSLDVLVAVYVLFVAYAILFLNAVLIALVPLLIVANLYLLWRFLVAVHSLERIVELLDADAD